MIKTKQHNKSPGKWQEPRSQVAELFRWNEEFVPKLENISYFLVLFEFEKLEQLDGLYWLFVIILVFMLLNILKSLLQQEMIHRAKPRWIFEGHFINLEQ